MKTKTFQFLQKNAVPTIFPSHELNSNSNNITVEEIVETISQSQNLVSNSNLASEETIEFQVIIGRQEEVLGQCEQSLETAKNHHNYDLPDQKELKRRNDSLCEEIKVVKKKLRLAEKSKHYYQKKCASLNDVIKVLKSRNLVSESAEEFLTEAGSKVPAHLFQRLKDCKKHKSNRRKKYSKELKSFAVTLQFYSSKAYNFVRNTFGLTLPHENVVRRWYSTIDAEPGFTKAAFDVLKLKVDQEAKKNKEVIVALIFDEVAIKKRVEFDGKKFVGCTDLGTGVEPDDMTPPATEALVFMVVALDGSWKLSIGYFLADHLKTEEKSNILRMAFKKLHDIGVKAVSVTCDCPATNFSTLKKLGSSFDVSSLKSSFTHPSDVNQQVAVVLDPCHLIKLARNCLSDLKVLVDPDGKRIEWEFIKKLEEVQKTEGMRAGNKLKKDHIHWHRQKMKVNLATQTLSRSVADAIDFCRDSLKYPEFQGSEATTKFIRTIDSLFDIMNSRNIYGKGTKSPMMESNHLQWNKIFSDALPYLSHISDLKGTKMIFSLRKSAFIGFILNIHSFQFLYISLVEAGKMKYLLTYKVSQDHLELFFCALRCRLGSNNNPTVREFKAAYKRLLLHQEIRGNRGNCLLQDDTSLLTFQKSKDIVTSQNVCDFSLQKKFGLAYEETDHDYAHVSCFPLLSEFQSSIVEYVSGFAVRMASKLVKCDECLEALQEQNFGANYLLVQKKDKGGLIHVSPSVHVTCEVTEQAIRVITKSAQHTPGGVTFKSDICAAITSSVMKNVVEKFD